MADLATLMVWLGAVVVLAPLVLVVGLGTATLLRHPPPERVTVWATYCATVVALVAAVGVFVLMLALDTRHVLIEFGDWAHIEGKQHFHFSIKFIFDRLTVPFAALSLVLCGTIGAFASRYMHREPGFNRFFVLYAVFMLGMVVAGLANTIETLFAGWEMVGLSSALLVGFFHERRAPVQNGLRVWIVYRASDAALVLAAVVLHHTLSEGDFDKLLGFRDLGTEGQLSWPEGDVRLPDGVLLLVGGLIIVAAAGKSALLPFSGWLPRAMEGPTPSSAVFYGALSVHLGAFLLLRFSPLLDESLLLSVVVVVLGLSTAAFAALTGRVQTDIKSALSFASLTQVGLIVAEIGCGLRYIALVHLLGHACLRTLQFVRAPTALRDRHSLENALGDRPEASAPALLRLFSPAARNWLYRFALERGYLDALLTDYIARPFVLAFRWCDALEGRATDALAGRTVAAVPAPVAQPQEVEQAL